MSQVTFPVILLFPFREHERSTALRTRNFKIWHRGFSKRVKKRIHTLFVLRSAGVAFLSTTGCGTKALFSNATPKAWTFRRFNWPECTPAIQCIQIFLIFSWPETVAKPLHQKAFCGCHATADMQKPRIFDGILVARVFWVR